MQDQDGYVKLRITAHTRRDLAMVKIGSPPGKSTSVNLSKPKYKSSSKNIRTLWNRRWPIPVVEQSDSMGGGAVKIAGGAVRTSILRNRGGETRTGS
jgi:hypothetical protein